MHLAQGRRRAPSDVITQRQHNQEPSFREKMILQVIFGILQYRVCDVKMCVGAQVEVLCQAT